MAEPNSDNRDILRDLAGIAAGFGLLAVAAIGAVAARQHRARSDVRPVARSLNDILRQRPIPRRRPPEAGLSLPAVPPRGPQPLQGGAAAPLDFGA
ncbi:MAG: hypothetical protein C0471_14220 [Erythrobacter sp.]|nr:hypothetical protein [Erythrobacter sp.]